MCVKPHSPDLNRGALATDARGCSLWRTLLERPPPAPESRVRDPLGELVRTRVGGVTLGLKNVHAMLFFLLFCNHIFCCVHVLNLKLKDYAHQPFSGKKVSNSPCLCRTSAMTHTMS